MESVTSTEQTGNGEGRGTPNWTVRPFRETDLPELLSLYSLVFRRERTEADFRWKLLRPGFPFDTVWVADDQGKIVGQHAGIPMRLKLGDREMAVVHAVEAMTHPDYRKGGMLTALGGALYARWGEEGSPLVLGLPHAGWGTRAHALGYRGAFTLRWTSRPLKPLAILAGKLASKGAPVTAREDSRRQGASFERHFGETSVTRITSATQELDALWRRVAPSYRNAVVRDAEWVQWRYLDAPEPRFIVLAARRGDKLSGYVAFRVVTLGGRSIGRIADVFTAPDDGHTLSALVRAANAFMRRQGADSVACLVAVGSPLHAALRRRGFLLNRGDYQASFILLSDKVDWAAISQPNDWLLTGGDYDVV